MAAGYALHCCSTVAPTTMSGWEGGWNSGHSMCLSDVGNMSLAASETYSRDGH